MRLKPAPPGTDQLLMGSLPPHEEPGAPEASGTVRQRGLRFLLTRSVWLVSTGGLLLLVFSLGLLIYSTWRYAERIEPVQAHLRYLVGIEIAQGEARNALLELLQSERSYLDPRELDGLRDELRDLRGSDASLVQDTPLMVKHALQQTIEFEGTNRYLLDETLTTLRTIFNRELGAHQSMIGALQAEARQGWHIAIGLSIGLLMISVLLWTMVRQRILAPLDKLADQMTLLARHDYSEVLLENADPMLHPMLETYNGMAQRLSELEQVQQQRQRSLTEEVRNATYMLLQQQRRLAQSERLGAVGEMAAGVAHELRNPLTSVQMALDNLRLDLQEPELVSRVTMISDEVKRVTRQLNQLLDQARQRPEVPVILNLGEELESLVSLVVYQLSEDISVHFRTQGQQRCRLPRSALWQALLNLVLNAGQILDKTGGDILIQTRRIDDMVEISVADSGPGFPPQMLEASLQPFRSWRVGGTGLGLVMVRRFASDLGGELLLSNRDEGGACVTLRLPCKTIDG